VKRGSSNAQVVGYVRTDNEDASLALPVIEINGNTYLQVTILETLRSFELLSYLSDYVATDAFSVNPSELLKQRIVCYIRDAEPAFFWADNHRDYLLAEVKRTDLPVSLRLQLADILSEHDLRIELENRSFHKLNAGSFAASVLRNSLLEKVMANLRSETDIKEASVVSLKACTYLIDSNLDRLPRNVLEPLLSITTATRDEIEQALQNRLESFSSLTDTDTFTLDLQLSQVRDLINRLKRSQRQELRVSQILQALLDEPRVALSALKQYEP